MIKALVVDDSRAMRTIMAAILKDAGVGAVVEAGNGSEGLERLRQNPDVRVALVDWNMPVMDGFDFVRSVRAEAVWSALSLVMVTTETEHAQVARALAAGANEYVMKPFTRDAIAGKLQLLGVI